MVAQEEVIFFLVAIKTYAKNISLNYYESDLKNKSPTYKKKVKNKN